LLDDEVELEDLPFVGVEAAVGLSHKSTTEWSSGLGWPNRGGAAPWTPGPPTVDGVEGSPAAGAPALLVESANGLAAAGGCCFRGVGVSERRSPDPLTPSQPPCSI